MAESQDLRLRLQDECRRNMQACSAAHVFMGQAVKDEIVQAAGEQLQLLCCTSAHVYCSLACWEALSLALLTHFSVLQAAVHLSAGTTRKPALLLITQSYLLSSAVEEERAKGLDGRI